MKQRNAGEILHAMKTILTVAQGNAEFLQEQLERLAELDVHSEPADTAYLEALRRFLRSGLLSTAHDVSAATQRLATHIAELAGATFDPRNAPPLVRAPGDSSDLEFDEVLRAVQTRVGTRILLVDDDPPLRLTLARQLTELGFDVTEAPDFPAATRAGLVFDLAIADLNLGDEGPMGFHLLASIRTLQPSAVVIAHSGYVCSALVCDAMRSGADWFVDKPASAERLVVSAARARGLFEHPPRVFQRISLDAALAFFVARVLHDTGGNKSRAAEVLKIGRGRIDRLLATQIQARETVGPPSTQTHRATTDGGHGLMNE